MDNDFKLITKPTVVLRSKNTLFITGAGGLTRFIPYKYEVVKCSRGFIISGKYRTWAFDKTLPIALVSDSGLPVWQKSITAPYNSGYKFLSAHLDNSDNLFLVTQVRTTRLIESEESQTELGGKTKLREIFIHQFDPSGNLIKSETLPMETMFESYSNFSCAFDTVSDRLNITGLYSNPLDKDGIFHFSYTLHPLTLKNKTTLPATRKMFSDMNLGDHSINDVKNHLEFKKQYDTKDGGYTLIFEDRDSVAPYYREADFYIEMMYNHHFNGLLLLHVNRNGQLAWSKVIRKITEGGHKEYLNTHTFMVDNKLYLLLNADKESIDRCEKKNSFYKRECYTKNINVLKVIAIDEQGNTIESESILPDAKIKYLCNLPKTKVLPDNKVELSFDLIDKKGNVTSRKTGYLSLPNAVN